MFAYTFNLSFFSTLQILLFLVIVSYSKMKTKEVIRPQVPLRPPCYDFSLVADPRFDSTN